MRLACVQTDVVFKDPEANLAHARQRIAEAKENGADLIVFPEAFLTGYCFDTKDEVIDHALRVHCDKNYDVTEADPTITALQSEAIDQDVHLVFGTVGKDDYGIFNCALLCEPNGRMRRYVKTHLPFLGVDRFVDPGSDLPAFQTDLGAIGILVCYDLRPPEAARVLALRGADIILLPTNWPARKGTSPALMCPARAMENKVFFASCNRIGHENGFSFRGESAIYDCGGATLADAGTEDKTIYADLDLSEARNKRSIIIPGAFESEALKSRRPELYKSLLD